jgi:hypothetical protein
MNKKKYRIIYNHDGATLMRPFAPFTDIPFSMKNFLDKTIGFLVGTQVDAVTWTLGTDNGYVPFQQSVGRATNLYCHETRVGERFYELEPPFQSKVWHLHAQRVKEMINQGDDPPRVVIECGHKHNLDVFLGFRMNDLHDGRPVERNCPAIIGTDIPMGYPVFKNRKFIVENIRGYICRQKIEHPERLIGEHPDLTRLCNIGFDYAHKEVRDFRLALIEEAVQKYDLDGIELDFLRHPIYFKPGEERSNSGLMTEFMGQVKEMLDRIGKLRSKKLKLIIRTVAPLQTALALGLDVDTWMKNNWIDGLITGIDDTIQPPIKDDSRTAHGYNCPFYASLKIEAVFKRMKYSNESFRAAAAYCYQSGADGIHLFNMNSIRDGRENYGLGKDYSFEPLREIGSYADIRDKDKHYVVDNLAEGHRYIDSGAFYEWTETMQKRFLKSEMGTELAQTILPARLSEDQTVAIPFSFADDPERAAEKNLNMKVTLKICIRDISGGDHRISIFINNTSIHTALLTAEYPVFFTVETPIESQLLKVNENELKVSLKRGNPDIISEIWIKTVDIFVEYV